MKKMLLLLVLSYSVTMFGQDFERGKELFKQNCAACHNMEKKRVGPPLQGTVAAQGRDWTKTWIKNSQALIKSGDTHAVEIWNEYNQAAMPSYSYLEDSDLESIVTYLADYTKDKEERMAEVTSEVVPVVGGTTVVQSQPTPTYLWILLIIAGIVVIGILYAFYVGMGAIVQIVTKTISTNTILMKKLNTDEEELEKEFDSLVEKKASKEIKDKVKVLKKELNDKLNKFK